MKWYLTKKTNYLFSKSNHNIFQGGYSFIELLVSLLILSVIFGISTINLSPLPSNTLQSTSVDLLISNIKSQQTKAMSTDSSYGVYFESNSYTMFKGDVYTQGLSENTVISLDSGITLSNVTFPNNVIVFSAGSGDVSNYLTGSDSFTVSSAVTNKTSVVKINKYGATY